MCRIEGVADLLHDLQDPVGLEGALALDDPLQVGALDQAHREIEVTTDLSGIVDRDDVGMIERRRHLRLADETLLEARALREVVGQDLQSDLAAQAQVLGHVDHARPSAPQKRVDPVTG